MGLKYQTGNEVSITQAARMLKLTRGEFYGVLRAYGIEPRQVDGNSVGRPPRVITRGQLASIRKRLKEANS